MNKPIETALEVWNGDRKVTVYEDVVIRIWGTDIDKEMSEEKRTHENVDAAFKWLYAPVDPHMTFERIDAAYHGWAKTITVGDPPTRRNSFHQGFVAGWNAKETNAEDLSKQLVKATVPQPIETAPRDGTIVDLWLTGGSRMTDQWWDEEDKSWCGLEESMFSHWSPIPGYAQIDD